MNTVFMTLRDAVADISVPVTCSRTLFDGLNPPLVEGASVVVHAKPSYYANRGTLSLYARDIRMVGLGELLARLERRRQLLAAEGLFAPELQAAAARSCPAASGWSPRPTRAAERDVLENARRRWPAVRFEVAYAAMQGQRSAAEVIEAVERLDRNPDVDVIVVARGGGSVEDLLPFSDEALIRAVHAVRTPVVSAIGHEPDQPLLDLVADVRASTPTDAAKLVVPDVVEELRSVDHARDRIRGARAPAGWPASRPGSTPCAPARRSPTRAPCSTPAPTRSTSCATAPAAACATPSTGPPTTSATSAPAPAPCRRWPPCSAATPCSRTPTATSSPRSPASPPEQPISVRVADGRIHATTTRVEADPRSRRAMTDQADPLRGRPRGADRRGPPPRGRRHHPRGVAGALGARRGARPICQDWLDGARKRLDAAMESDDD